jgi:predicted RNase H-like nuclease (RuvC/YqgF family)
MINDIFSDSKKNNLNHLLNAEETSKLFFKAKEANLIINMKTQHKELKKELKEKEKEIENLKKTIKMTKIKELNIETKTYLEEISKMKVYYENYQLMLTE